MKRALAALAFASLLGACAGLASDINKGAGTTEREIMHEKKHDAPSAPPADAGAHAPDSGAISI